MAVPTLPLPPMVGRYFKNVLVQGVVNNGDGTFTTGTAADLKVLGVFDGLEFSLSPKLAEISPLDAAFENNVITKAGIEATLTEIIGASGFSQLEAAMLQYDLFRVQWNIQSPFGNTAAVCRATYLTRGPYKPTYNTEKNTVSLSFVTAGVGIAVGIASVVNAF